MIPSDDFSSLALLYHLNSEPNFDDADESLLNDFCNRKVSAKYIGDTFPGIVLPNVEDSNLGHLLARRYSCRTFASIQMPLTCLSAILQHGYGLAARGEDPRRSRSLFRRTVPSAGGIYPLRLYAAVQRVGDIPDGLYQYNVYWPSLEPVTTVNIFDQLAACLITKDFVANANMLLVISATFESVLSKYGPRGYRYLLLEAGHVGQNFCLAAATAQLASLCVGGFRDTELNSLLKLDGTSEAALYCIAIGYAAT